MSTESERVARLTAEGERFVPEGTGPKVYVVTCKNKSDWDEIHNYIINENEIDGIPNRKIECTDDCRSCDRMASYEMSDEEANQLKSHPKVAGVQLDPDYYQGTFKGYADEVISPRQITETNSGFIIVGSKSGDKILALSDKDQDGYAEEKITIASGLKNPTGVTYHNKNLYFAEIEEVWMIKNIDAWLLSNRQVPPVVELFMDNLPSETWHGFRHIRFGPDDNMYIPIGVPCNICIEPQTKDKRFAAIHKYDNGELVMVADGVRNSVGIDWHPVTKKLYFSDNGREATLIELLVDSEGYVQRLKNHMASPIAAEITDLVDFKGWHIYGNAKPDLKEALKPMGATFQSYFFGFNHSI